MAEIVAVAPTAEVIHLHKADYQPGRKTRSGREHAALCNISVYYQLRNNLTAPLAEALKWLQRKPTVDDPRAPWRLCHVCLGHALKITDLTDAVLFWVVLEQDAKQRKEAASG